MLSGPDGELPEKLRNLEPRLIEHISNEIMDRDPNVRWDDIGNMRCNIPVLTRNEKKRFESFFHFIVCEFVLICLRCWIIL